MVCSFCSGETPGVLYLGYVWSQFRMESEMGMVQYMGPDPRYQWVASF